MWDVICDAAGFLADRSEEPGDKTYYDGPERKPAKTKVNIFSNEEEYKKHHEALMTNDNDDRTIIEGLYDDRDRNLDDW